MRNIFILLILCSQLATYAHAEIDVEADDLEYNLSDAIMRSNFKHAKELIEKGADVNKKQEPFNQAPIVAAALRGYEFVELLLENGADINSTDQDNNTALLNACLYGNIKVVKYLISKGADLNTVNNDGVSILDAAKISEDKVLIELIKTHQSK